MSLKHSFMGTKYYFLVKGTHDLRIVIKNNCFMYKNCAQL